MNILTRAAAGMLLGAGIAVAQPTAINVHGAVASPSGEPITGARAYVVRFFDAQNGGNQLGSVYTGTVAVSPSGVFNIPITPPPAIFVVSEVWYELGIDTDTPVDNSALDDLFTGRVPVYSVPFALQAAEAAHVEVEAVGDGSISQAELSTLEGATSNLQTQLNTLSAAAGDVDADIAALQSEQATQATAIAGKAAVADVYTKGEIDTQQGAQDTAIAAKAAAADVYTKGEIDTQQGAQDTAIAAKAAAADVYTKGEIDTQQGAQDTAIAGKASAADVYTKGEIDTQQGAQDTAIAGKAAAADVYTKGEIDTQQGAQDTAIAGKASAADVYTKGEIDTQQGAQDTAIAAKADAADVYTEAEADAAFVNVDGDTLSGSLGVSDTTASTNTSTGALVVAGGVGVGGALNVAEQVSTTGAVLSPLALAPGTTANTLYNVGGDLFFGSFQLNAPDTLGSAIDSSEITDDTIVDADINSSANIAASKLSSSVVLSGEGVAQLTNDAGYLVSVGSSNITDGTIVDADISSSANIATSKLSSDVVVSGEGVAQLSNNAGYLTAEADTLSAVTGRGATTSTQITLNGGVKTDTVSEVTSANGVSIDGVKLKDNFVELTSISAPSPTTNRLYNEGGTLKFNGTALGGGGGTKYAFIPWQYTTFTTLIMAGRDVFTAKMPMAGTITGLQVYCRQDSSVVGTWSIRINGSSVTGDLNAATTFDDNVYYDLSSSLSGASFSAGATISLYGTFSSGQVNQPMVFLTISY